MSVRGLLFRAGALAGMGVLGTTERAAAQVDAFWTNGAGGNWSTGSNWSTDPDYPKNNGTKYNAFILIPGAPPPYTVAMTEDIALDNFNLESPDATLDLGGFKFTIEFAYTQKAGVLNLTSAAPNQVEVRGETLLDAGAAGLQLDGANGSGFVALGEFTFQGVNGAGIIICDIDVELKGGLATWKGTAGISLGSGASLTNGEGTTFTIENDELLKWTAFGATPTFFNWGVLVKSGGTGSSTFQDVAFDNQGTLRIETGTFATDGVDVNGNGNTLSGGTWEVTAGSTLDLVGQTILKNAAIVRLSDAGSTFAALDSVSENMAAGELIFENGRNFTTAGNFRNDGRVEVGEATTFEVAPGSSLQNYNAVSKKLTGGVFDLGGTLRFDGTGIATLAGAITLDGAGSAVLTGTGDDALVALKTITAGGHFEITGGRNFETGGDFRVVQTGLLTIDAGSLFRVKAGSVLQNLVSGDFDDANFDLKGLLQVDAASIKNLGTNLTLDGAGSGIIDENGNDALTALALIKPQGVLTLANGRTLSVLDTLVVEGQLKFATSGGDSENILTVQSGDLIQTRGQTRITNGRIIVEMGAFRLEGGVLSGDGTLEAMLRAGARVAPGEAGPGFMNIAGPIEMGEEGQYVVEIFGPGPGGTDVLRTGMHASFDELGDLLAGDLRIVRPTGFVPMQGQFFDVMFWGTRAGEFATVHGRFFGSGRFDLVYLPDRLRLVAVPAPGTMAGLVGALVLGLRRRR